MPEDLKLLCGEIVVEAVNVDEVPIIAKASTLSLGLCSYSKSWEQKPWRRRAEEVRGELQGQSWEQERRVLLAGRPLRGIDTQLVPGDIWENSLFRMLK